MDFGGMVCTKDPQISIPLGPDRAFGCWVHQVSDVLRALVNAKSEVVKRPGHSSVFYRIGSWPCHLLFISAADRAKLLKALWAKVSVKAEQAHGMAMLDALVTANVKSTGIPEKEIREILLAQQTKLLGNGGGDEVDSSSV